MTPTRGVGFATLTLIVGLVVPLSPIVPDAHPASQGSPEALWEAFPLDPSDAGPGAGAGGITLEQPEPLPSAPPESAGGAGGEAATDAVPPGIDGDEESGGVATLALMAIAAVALLVIGVTAAAMRVAHARRHVSDSSPASPRPERSGHRSPDPSSPAVAHRPDPVPTATSAATEATPSQRGASDPRPASTGEPPAPTSEPEPPAPMAAEPGTDFDEIYGPALCLEFASGLSDDILSRAIVLFGLLSRDGSVDSATAADALGVTPRELPGVIITPLRRRADALSLPVAYSAERDEQTGRRRWRDRGGVAGRLREAAITIQTARAVTSADATREGEASRTPS